MSTTHKIDCLAGANCMPPGYPRSRKTRYRPFLARTEAYTPIGGVPYGNPGSGDGTHIEERKSLDSDTTSPRAGGRGSGPT
jgi:hypothetical protein